MADELSLSALSKAIGDIESGGHDDPYSAVGPPAASGDRAYGKYQVMGNNIPSWTEESGLGRMSPQQFMGNPDAQEKVFRTRMGKYLDDNGGSVRDAASMWHSGVPYNRAAAEGRIDHAGTRTVDYADHIDKAVGGDGRTQVAAPPPPPDTPAVSPKTVLNDPKFWQLADDDRLSVMQKIDPRFAALKPEDQQQVLAATDPRAKTQLTPDEETSYRQWTAQQSQQLGRPINPDDYTYDMRGYWKDIASQGKSETGQVGGETHFPDTYKTPYHPTFSVESKYANLAPDKAGHWEGETYIPAGKSTPPTTTVEKPAWYSGLADEAGEKFATAVSNALESGKSLAQKPESGMQVIRDLFGLLEPWTVTSEMSGTASERAAKAGGAGPLGQKIARETGATVGALITPAPPGFGIASKLLGRGVSKVLGRGEALVPEAVSAARAEAPEAAAAAERVGATGTAPSEAAAASREALAPSGATTETVGGAAKTALKERAKTFETMAGGVYDKAIENAQAEGKVLDPARYQSLDAHLKEVRKTLGAQLSPEADNAITNLESRIASGIEPPVPAGSVRLYRGEIAPGSPAFKEGTKSRLWMTDSRELAENFAKTHGESGRVSYLDVPANELENYRIADAPKGYFQANPVDVERFQTLPAVQPVRPNDLAAYKYAVDTTFPGKMKSGTEVRDALRSMFSPEDRSWAEAADTMWRDELRGQGMTESSLGAIVKLAKKSDPSAVVEKLFGGGDRMLSDRQGAIGRAVLKHLEYEDPKLAGQVKDALFDRAVSRATASDGTFSARALVNEFDKLKPLHSAIASPEKKAFFDVLRNQLEKGDAKPGMVAHIVAEGISLVVGHKVGAALGSPLLGVMMRHQIIPAGKLTEMLGNPKVARALTRALQTPAKSAIAPALIQQMNVPDTESSNAAP